MMIGCTNGNRVFFMGKKKLSEPGERMIQEGQYNSGIHPEQTKHMMRNMLREGKSRENILLTIAKWAISIVKSN